MKRHVLFLSLLVLAGLIFSSSAAGALEYPVYKLVPRAAKMTFAAFATGTSLDSAVVDYVVTDPQSDSTITTLHVGDRTTIAGGERVYLAGAVGDTFTFTQIGSSSAAALVLSAPGVVISDSPLAPLRVQGTKNNLTQILGPGPEHGTIGIVVSNEGEVEYTLLAGHYIGTVESHQSHSIKISINNFYVTNSGRGLVDLVGEVTNNDVIRIDIRNAIFWKNSGYDLTSKNLTKGHIMLNAENCAFLSDGGNTGGFSVGFDTDNESPDKLKYTAKFVDCVFNRSMWTWAPGDESTYTRRTQNDGVIKVLETRPGHSDPVQVWPLTAPLNPADFNVDGIVSIADFTYMATDFGLDVGQSRFARHYDLDKSGLVDLRDTMWWISDYLGLGLDVGADVVADQLANTAAGKDLLKVIAVQQSSPMVEAIMADPVLRGALEPYLQLTAVEEDQIVPTALGLSQNYPNPFNPATTIRFDLAESGDVRVSIYAMSGQLVKTLLANTLLPAGQHQLQWDGDDSFGLPVASGNYIYVLIAGKNTFHRKMLLLR